MFNKGSIFDLSNFDARKVWRQIREREDFAETTGMERDYQASIFFPLLGWLAFVAFSIPFSYNLIFVGDFRPALVYALYNTVYYVALALLLYYGTSYLAIKFIAPILALNVYPLEWERFVVESIKPYIFVGMFWVLLRIFTTMWFIPVLIVVLFQLYIIYHSGKHYWMLRSKAISIRFTLFVIAFEFLLVSLGSIVFSIFVVDF